HTTLFRSGGLGERIVTGLALNDHAMLLAGAVPAAALALVVQGLFALVERLAAARPAGRAGTPRGHSPGKAPVSRSSCRDCSRWSSGSRRRAPRPERAPRGPTRRNGPCSRDRARSAACP